METEQQIEIEGRTLKEAIEKACELLEVAKKDIEYKLDADHFRGGADTVKIKAWRRPKEERQIGEEAKHLVTGILSRMGVGGKVDVEVSDEAVRVIIVTEDSQVLVGRNGATLESLQHLVAKALTHDKGEKRITIELENYKEKREFNLRLITQKICEKVLAEKCTVTLKPMNAYDRRLVHMEVAQYAGVESRSLGEGMVKRLQIYAAPEASTEASAAE